MTAMLDNTIPENPIKRLCSINGWSIEHISRQTNLTRNTINFIMRGTYLNIPDRLHFFFKERLDDNYSPYEMNNSYHQWQHLKQMSASIPPFTREAFTTEADEEEISHPLVNYLAYYNMSTMGFCEELALHKPTIYNYISKRQLKMPQLLHDALKRARISPEQISLLDRLSREFYTHAQRKSIEEIRDTNEFRGNG